MGYNSHTNRETKAYENDCCFWQRVRVSRTLRKKLAEQLNTVCVSWQEAGRLDQYETVIYIGSLYAGGVPGFQKTAGKFDLRGKRLIIATVGLADPYDSTNIENIRAAPENQIPSEVCKRAQIFHLRGAIDYSRLSLK
ncbi:MAG: hypothetical protein HUJ54_09740, partial [Erysipelotrichaceae bacterium]|nr:hypothetical protein [Erysipelotrichaceae bacterium]